TATDVIGGPSSNLYAAATGETNMLPAPGSQDYERVEKETQAPSEPSAPTVQLPEVTVSPKEETPVVGGGTTTPDVKPAAEPPADTTTAAAERTEAQKEAPTEPVSQALGVPETGGKGIIQQTQAFSEEPFGGSTQAPPSAPAAAEPITPSVAPEPMVPA